MIDKNKESERLKKSKRKRTLRILEAVFIAAISISLISLLFYNFVWKDYLAIKEISWSEVDKKFGAGFNFLTQEIFFGVTPEAIEELKKVEVAEQRGDIFVLKWKDKSLAPVKFRSPHPWYYTPTVLSKAFRENDVIVVKKMAFNWLIVTTVFLIVGNLFIMYLVFVRMARSGSSIFGDKKKNILGLAKIPSTKFDDVAGIDEVLEEVKQVVDQMKNPEGYEKLGAKMIRGILLQGPPGCGKTLTARAIAGEAGVSFIARSGSDFVEMISGLGSKRVRELFEEARDNAPCIIFIDEIDSIGKVRGGSGGDTSGAQAERDQTLNQLCVEMDGFNPRLGILVIAATNRADTIDPALLRSGRFDRKLFVSRPDLRGREAILKVHSRGKPLEEKIDFLPIAKGTVGFSGADLADLVNKAAIRAAELQEERDESQKVKILMEDLQYSRDQILMGEGQDKRHISEEEKRHSAFYEAAKVIVAKADPFADPVYKVSILPRGTLLGKTQLLPEERHYISNKHLLAQARMLLAGRAIEEILEEEGSLIQRSSRATDDIREADNLIMRIMCEFAMDCKLPPRVFGKKEELGYGGSGIGRFRRDFSEETAETIDRRKKEIISTCIEDDKKILAGKRDLLNKLAEKLISEEELEAEEIDVIFKS